MNVLGMDFGGTKVALRAQSDDGRAEEARLRIGRDEPAEDVLARAFDAARHLQASIGPVTSVGVSTPGIVFDDRVELAPNVAGWTELDLPARLGEEFGTAVLAIENDVKAAALAECTEGALQGLAVGLYVNLGTGIAIAPVVEGRLLRGAHGAAGEIGYGIVGAVEAWDAAALTLEEFAGGSGLTRRVAAAEDVAAQDAAQLVRACEDSAAARGMWREAVDEIARHLVTAALTVDPERIAIGGGMTRAGAALMEPLAARLTAAIPYPPQIVLSRFDADASLRGAVLLARGIR